jgi:branched-chain amino acid transport system substrate-binding protein
MLKRRTVLRTAVAGLAAGTAAATAGQARAAGPITIGFGMALTGGIAPNGKAALLAMQIWESDTNAKGGLLGRPVKLVYYDDQSNPSLVPGIYTKLLDVDNVDLVVSGYATNMVAPALPVVMQHDAVFLGLLGLDANAEFKYPRYFSMNPAGGPRPREAFARGFFDLAMQQTPKPKTLAIAGADAEFPRNAIDGVLAIAKELGLTLVYNKTYPPTTPDYTPIIHAIQATNPDIVFVASYPPDTVGMVRAANEVGLKTKMFGGGMVGLQTTGIKAQLGPLLNGIVVYDFFLPWAKFASPEALAFLKAYQQKAEGSGVDPLGYYLPPLAYSTMQVLGQAVEATKSLDQEKLAEYIRGATFKTLVGDVRFGPRGEWAEAQVITVQFQNVKGNGIDQFRDPKTEAILWPADGKTGTLIYPYTDAKT